MMMESDSNSSCGSVVLSGNVYGDDGIAFALEARVALLVASMFFAGKAAKMLGIAPLLGQILAGIVLGPPLADLIPYADAFKLLGKLGILLYVIEGGLDLEFEQVRRHAARAFCAAFVGVLCPLGLSFLFLTIFPPNVDISSKGKIAAGAAVAPTSLGFTASLLAAYGDDKTDLGVTVCVTAVLDDILSLLLLSEIQALGEARITAWNITKPILASFLSVILGVTICIAMPSIIHNVKNRAPFLLRSGFVPLILLISLALSYFCAAIGSSDLLGSFLGGIAFSKAREAKTDWETQCKRITQWGTRFFFAATIGFAVPSLVDAGSLFDAASIATGGGLFFAGLFGKLALGVFAKPPRTYTSFLKFGFAMAGRGEFGFIISEQAYNEHLFDSYTYSGVIWSLLGNCVASSVGFRFVSASRSEGATSTASSSLPSETRNANAAAAQDTTTITAV